MKTALTLVLFFAASVCLAGEIKIVSGIAAYEFVFSKYQKEFEAKTGHKLVYIMDQKKTSSVITFSKVLSGDADLGASPFAWEDWAKVLSKNGIKDDDIKSMTRRTIGHDYLHLYANKDAGDIKSISSDQAKKLITGKIVNWKEVGGADLPAKFVLQSPSSNDFVKNALLGKEDFDKDSITSKGIEDMLGIVAKTSGGFGAASKVSSAANLTEITITPPVGRPITAITKGKPKPEVLELLNFLAEKKN